MSSGKAFMVILCALLLASCGGGEVETLEPTPNTNDPIADSVQQTLAAIAVAQTVEVIMTGQAPPTAAPVQATEVPPTAVVLPSPTTAPTTAPTTQTQATLPPTLPPPPPTNPPPSPTSPPTPTFNAPPFVENDAPGGSFPEDGTVSFNIIVDPSFLFRMDVRDLAFGNFEGAGIESVGFSISGNGVNYFREERNPGFCVFGGGEPHCNPWPTNEHGQYTWGEDGPVVQSGDYFVNMGVTAQEPDEEFFGNWNWNFDFRVTVP